MKPWLIVLSFLSFIVGASSHAADTLSGTYNCMTPGHPEQTSLLRLDLTQSKISLYIEGIRRNGTLIDQSALLNSSERDIGMSRWDLQVRNAVESRIALLKTANGTLMVMDIISPISAALLDAEDANDGDNDDEDADSENTEEEEAASTPPPAISIEPVAICQPALL